MNDKQVDSNKIIQLDYNDLENNLMVAFKDQILKGLFRGNFAFLIASPDSGKSYLSLSIAYELACPEHQLIGVTASPSNPLKTLIWPIEDSLVGIIPRVKKHLSSFSEAIKDKIKNNI